MRLAAVPFAILGAVLLAIAVFSFATGGARPRMAFLGLVGAGLLYQAYALVRARPAARVSALVLAGFLALASSAGFILLLAIAPSGRAPGVLVEVPMIFGTLAALSFGFAAAALALLRSKPWPIEGRKL